MPSQIIQSYLSNKSIPRQYREQVFNDLNNGTVDEQTLEESLKNTYLKESPAVAQTLETFGKAKTAKQAGTLDPEYQGALRYFGGDEEKAKEAVESKSGLQKIWGSIEDSALKGGEGIQKLGAAITGDTSALEGYRQFYNLKTPGEIDVKKLTPEERGQMVGEGMIDFSTGTLGASMAPMGGLVEATPIVGEPIGKAFGKAQKTGGKIISEPVKFVADKLGIKLSQEQLDAIDEGGETTAGLYMIKIAEDAAKMAKSEALSTKIQDAMRKGDLKTVKTLLPEYEASIFKPTIAGHLGEAIGAISSTALSGMKSLARMPGKGIAKAGKSLYETAITPNVKEAELTQSYKAGRIAEKPTTKASTALEKGLMGTESMLGVQAAKTADALKSKITPELQKVKTPVKTAEYFTKVQERINKVNEPGRKAELQKGLDALKEDYANMPENTIENWQNIKSELDSFTPQKMFKGEDVAQGYRQVKHWFADAIRGKTYDLLKDKNIKQDYIDWGNMMELEKLGIKARTSGGFQGGAGKWITSAWQLATTPIKTIGGQILYRVGKFLEFKSSKRVETLGEYLESQGWKKEDFTPLKEQQKQESQPQRPVDVKGEVQNQYKSNSLEHSPTIPQPKGKVKSFNSGEIPPTNLPKTQKSATMGDMNLINEAKKYKSAEEFVKAQGTPTLPKEISVYEEAKAVGAKRIAPDRIAHQQLTPEEGINALIEKAKKRADNNSNSWIKASEAIQNLINKYGDKLPKRTAEAIQKYPNLMDDFYKYNDLKKYANNSNLSGMKDEFLQKAERAKWNPVMAEKYKQSVVDEYKNLVKADISKGYKYPDEVLNYDKSFKTAVDNRARYEKGLATSFSADDSRIVFDEQNRIVAGMKRQDGKELLPVQKQEIIDGVLQTQKALGIDLNQLSKDERWVYAHLNGKNPFLTKNAAGMYRRGSDYASVSLGGSESFDAIINGEKVRQRVNTTAAHEIGHALDGNVKGKLLDSPTVWDLKRTFKPVENSSRGDKYWRSDSEVTARAIEEYVAVKEGHTGLFNREGYWNKEIFESKIKPAVEKAIDTHFSEYKTKSQLTDIFNKAHKK